LTGTGNPRSWTGEECQGGTETGKMKGRRKGEYLRDEKVSLSCGEVFKMGVFKRGGPGPTKTLGDDFPGNGNGAGWGTPFGKIK